MQSIPKHWFHNSIFISSLFDASSVTIPDGERFIIASVQKLLPRVTNTELKTKLVTLLHEEAAHFRVHDAYNHMLVREGYRIGFATNLGKKTFTFFAKHCSGMTNLGISMCVEYFTLLFSKQILEHNVLNADGVDERLKRVWTWHSLEELEHRSACFDLYSHLHGGYLRRFATMLVASFLLFPIVHVSHFSLLRQNREKHNKKVLRGGAKFLFGKDGVYRHLFGGWLQYFKKDFHPRQIAIAPTIQKELYHHHVEDELIQYFQS